MFGLGLGRLGLSGGSSTWTAASYNYSTPATASTPAAGEVIHADNIVNKLLFSLTDADGFPRSPSAFTTGRIVTFNGASYTIDAATVVYPTYCSVTITPTTQQVDALYVFIVSDPEPVLSGLFEDDGTTALFEDDGTTALTQD